MTISPHHPRKYVNPYRKAPFSRSVTDSGERVGYVLDKGGVVHFVEFWNIYRTETFIRYYRSRRTFDQFIKSIGRAAVKSHGRMRKAEGKSDAVR